MTFDDFNILLEDRIAKTKAVLSAKSAEYSANDDKLYNFKRGAAITGEKPAKVCVGFMTKHLVSVLDLVNGVKEANPANIDEKLGDLINYCILLEALLIESLEK